MYAEERLDKWIETLNWMQTNVMPVKGEITIKADQLADLISTMEQAAAEISGFVYGSL